MKKSGAVSGLLLGVAMVRLRFLTLSASVAAFQTSVAGPESLN